MSVCTKFNVVSSLIAMNYEVHVFKIQPSLVVVVVVVVVVVAVVVVVIVVVIVVVVVAVVVVVGVHRIQPTVG